MKYFYFLSSFRYFYGRRTNDSGPVAVRSRPDDGMPRDEAWVALNPASILGSQGADNGVRHPPRRAQPHQQKLRLAWGSINRFLGRQAADQQRATH
jgi:hypothetical protein